MDDFGDVYLCSSLVVIRHPAPPARWTLVMLFSMGSSLPTNALGPSTRSRERPWRRRYRDRIENPHDDGEPASTTWRRVARIRGIWIGPRRLVDSAMQHLRKHRPGWVDDSWWVALVPPTKLRSLDTRYPHRLRNPRRQFLADPLPLAGRSDEFLVEQYDFVARKGSISHLRFTETGTAFLRERVIEESFHLSYPMSFQYSDRTWVICEAATSGETHLWEYLPDVGRSRRVTPPLFDYPLRDVTVFRDDTAWYLLATSVDPDWHLVLYTAVNPLCGWTEVPLDSRMLAFRLAGLPEPAHDNDGEPGESSPQWLLPLQGNSGGYGSELVLGCLRIGDTATLEEDRTYDPPPPFIGMHTVAFSASVGLIDLKHLRLRPERIFRRLKPRRVLSRLLRFHPRAPTSGSGGWNC